MGGEQTTIILNESILQREFTGDWIDEVEFNYQNALIGTGGTCCPGCRLGPPADLICDKRRFS